MDLHFIFSIFSSLVLLLCPISIADNPVIISEQIQTPVKKPQTIKQNPLIRYIGTRIKQNKHCIIIFVGPPGSSKSYSLLRLAEILDPTFAPNLKRRCFFQAKKFMEGLKAGIDQKELTAGKVIFWDELGAEHNAREFMSITNRAINSYFQTCRHSQLIILMTVPVFSFIDSSTRKLITLVGETQGIDRTKNAASVKIKLIQTNALSGQSYFKYIRYRSEGRPYVMKRIAVGLPSKETIDTYEQMKNDYSAHLRDKIIDDLQKVENKGKKYPSPMQQKVLDLLDKNSMEEIATQLKLSESVVRAHKSRLEQKGYSFKPIWKDKRVIRYEIEGINQNSLEKPNDANF